MGNATNLHTYDRNTLRAHLEAGIGDSETLKTYTETKIKV